MKKLYYFLAVSMIGFSKLNAQPLLQYSNTYSYPGAGAEKGISIDYDNIGNAFVTGTTDANGNNDIITVKYSPSGTKLWEAIYSGTGNGDDRPIKIKYANNKVYVAGYTKGSGTGYDWVTICYNVTGSGIQTEAWKAIYNDQYNGDDKATDMEIDNGGNVYVSGTSYNSLAKTDAYLIKYNGVNGSKIRELSKRENSSYNTTSYDIAINTSNKVFFATSLYGYPYSYQGDTYLYTLDTALNNAGSYYRAEYVPALTKIIPYGNSYYIIIDGGLGTSIAKIPIGSNNSTWVTDRFGAAYPTYTNIFDYDIDESGNPYVLWHDTISGGTSVNTYKWAKLNGATGDTIYTRLFNPSTSIDRPLQIKIGHQNTPTVYITGNSVVSGKLQNFTVGYSSDDGSYLWTLNQSCSGTGNKSVTDMKIDNNNTIYMTGASSCGGNSDALTVKYCSNVVANAGVDKSVCNGSDVQIGAASITGNIYSWSPTTGLSDPDISNPLAYPTSNTTYVLTVTSPSGCSAKDTVNVTVIDCPPCPEPSGLSATTTQTSATVRWNSVAGAVSYTLQYKENVSSTWSSPITITSTSYTITGLVCSTPFQWKVQTNCTYNTSDLSTSTFTTSACVGGLPNLGKSLDNISLAANSFTISATVQNYGGSTAGACTVGYYLSTDPTFNTGRILVGASSLPAIAAGNASSVSATINLCGRGLTNDVPYYIGYYIDNTFIVSEPTESDNGYWYWGTFPITLHCNLVPSNDQCSGVTTLSCGSNISGSTTYASSTNDPTGTCIISSGAPGVWYKIAGNGKIMTASLCGSSYDTKIQIYSGSCSNLTCVTGNDDSCSTQSEVIWTSSNGITYYIFVYGYGDNVGDYQLNITCVNPTAINNKYKVINGIDLYPNPVSQNLNVKIQSNKNVDTQLHILDISGKEIYVKEVQIQKGDNYQTIDVSRFAKGMYLLQINDEEGITAVKFIVE